MPQTFLVAHWGRLGAGPRITARMAEALAALPGVEVLASIDRDADSVPELPAGDVRLEHTYTRRSEILTRVPQLLALSLRTRRWIRSRRVDVYFSPMMSIWGAFATWVVVPRHVLAVVVVHDPQQHPGDRHPVLELCRRVEMARADVLVAFSEHSARELRKYVPARKPIVWVPHGTDADPSVVARSASRERAVIGFFGRISEYKGIDLYVEVVELVRRRFPDAIGRVVGNGEVPDGLRERSSGVEWRVGWVDEGEVEAVVDDFDVVVLPYREASQSGVLPLAASRGVPAVVTPVGGLAEQAAASGNAVVADGLGASAVADAVVRLLDDPAHYGARSAAGLAAVTGDTSWGAVAERLVDQLRPLVR